MNDKLLEYSGNSAPFHVGVGLMLFNRGLSFIINKINPDDGDSRNLEINDEDALKKKLFSIISKKYNARLRHHELKFGELSSNHFSKFKIIKYRFMKEFDGDDPSGQYSLFPNAFVCKSCGHYVMNENLGSFDPNKCKLCHSGKYEQISLLRFCEDCGKIDKFFYQCKVHGRDYIKLVRGDKDNLLTWQFKCDKCDTHLDIFDFKCAHRISSKSIPIRDGETKFKPITIRESGIFSPQVATHIDLPKTKPLRDLAVDKNLVMFGFYFDSFKELHRIKDVTNIFSILSSYESDKRDGYEINEQKEKDVAKINQILDGLQKKKESMDQDVLEEFNELNTLKGGVESPTFEDYLRKHETEEIVIQDKLSHYNNLLDEFGFSKISYLPNIKLINSLIGIIKGINKFWDEKEQPHFELFWKSLSQELVAPAFKQVDREAEPFYAYSYPFETEAVLIEFKAKNICNWLFKNGLVAKEFNNEQSAKEFLLNLSPAENKLLYDVIYSLLHTMSHLILKNIHIHTGVGIESCGEKIFVSGGSILIYANNNLNIGALQYLFENKMFCEESIFRDIKLKINYCSFDPLCIENKGACFSCLFIPEFVCANFNLRLDRDLYLGSGRQRKLRDGTPLYKISTSYWDIK
ncbi:MAG: hypothetical protein ACOCP4_01400 [Candidatus Woesearchaeota archaeon]